MITPRFSRLAWTIALTGLLLGTTQPVLAADTVTIPATFPYADDQVGTSTLREQCRWNTTIPLEMVSQSNGGVVMSTQDLATVEGKKLFVTVTSLGAEGGTQSGLKWITIHGELKEGDTLVGSFNFRRATKSVHLSACGSLSLLGAQLGRDILAWLDNPVTTGPISNKGH